MDRDLIEVREEHACYGGRMGFYTHPAATTDCPMNFAVFLPAPAIAADPVAVPALYFLAGLTCSEENFMIKAGAARYAAELGLALVSCDTSPRGLGLPGEDEDWDLGTGAGFYVDANQPPWDGHYRMGSYVARELPEMIEREFPVLRKRRGICGHSMGGHGALVTALRDPRRWDSVSAFAPISNPMHAPWGQKAFSAYLGQDPESWGEWDASVLMSNKPHHARILVDFGLEDPYLEEQLQPEALEDAAAHSHQPLRLRRQRGYDHSYWFVQSFIGEHLAHHAETLKKGL